MRSRRTATKSVVKSGTVEGELKSTLNESSSDFIDRLGPTIRQVYDQQPEFDEDPDTDQGGEEVELINRPAKAVAEGGQYQGNWNKKTKQRHGYGICIWSDGSIYQGFWKNDKPNGRGRRIFVDTDVYNGTFKDGKMDGEGEYINDDGSTYKGQWK